MALMTAAQYIESLRKLNTRVYMFGEKIERLGRSSDYPPVHQLRGSDLRSGTGSAVR